MTIELYQFLGMMTVGNELKIKSPFVLLMALFPVSILLFLGKPWLLGVIPLGFLSLYEYVQLKRKSRRHSNSLIHFTAQDQLERLSIDLEQLLFLSTKDKFTCIHYLNKGQVEQKLLRGSLKHFEAQLEDIPVQRCHLSYIVNLTHVRFIGGNAEGLKLYLRNVDDPIPVSNKYRSAISSSLQTLSERVST
ncbi:LytR/AlgR family response regulator transcription factor [Haliscomenobacter sp.]|uniref:LytR/AlgR family response regulator transcription factor n=1 Tax=Haliscomenobacter sp. TaxID=2717303 RepID=UPI003593908C